ncbi:MAG: membrane protein [Caldimonas sp.]|uniref:TM2 domain-containing protein n=1 Tax=Caldimonas taiwanensis TaxID=307483 RepID=UPI00078075DD|nr:TM2 domain-containing protein [Caldimonas taiwanensis]GIX24342.1 MAG: membrane protein [Caldimonas sp.]
MTTPPESAALAPAGPYKSKTLATWIALLAGSLGLHRLYLHGWRDWLGWLHPVPTTLGVFGVQRMLTFGQDDRLSWLLIPLLGLMVSQAMLMAILYGLTPDDQWNARFNPHGPEHRSGWAVVIGVIAALMIGAAVLMATLAFGFQHYFELQVEAARQISQ